MKGPRGEGEQDGLFDLHHHPSPFSPGLFNTGRTKQPRAVKAAPLMIGAIKKPAVQLAVKDHLHFLHPATHLFLHNTPVRVAAMHPTSSSTPDSTQQSN